MQTVPHPGYQRNPDPPRRYDALDALEREMTALVRGVSGLELLALIDQYQHELAGADEYGADAEVARILVGCRLGPCLRELSRRERRHAAGTGPDPKPGWVRDWDAIRRDVLTHVDLEDLFAREGWPTRREGQESHSGCPFCADGHDRLVLFKQEPGKPRHFWCRQCGMRGDALTFIRSVRRLTFEAALIELAGAAGVPLPWPEGGRR